MSQQEPNSSFFNHATTKVHQARPSWVGSWCFTTKLRPCRCIAYCYSGSNNSCLTLFRMRGDTNTKNSIWYQQPELVFLLVASHYKNKSNNAAQVSLTSYFVRLLCVSHVMTTKRERLRPFLWCTCSWACTKRIGISIERLVEKFSANQMVNIGYRLIRWNYLIELI